MQRDDNASKLRVFRDTPISGFSYTSFPYSSSVHIYNLVYDSDVWNLYIDNNLYYTFTNIYKWIFIGFGKPGYPNYTIGWNDRNELYWMTLTDKPSSIVPKNPYTLDNKNDNMYGISTE